MIKRYNWNINFRLNVVDRQAIIVFSRNSYIGLYDDSAAAGIESIIRNYIRPNRALVIDRSCRRTAGRFIRVLRKHQVILECSRSTWRKRKPETRSFVSFFPKDCEISPRQLSALRRLVAGPGRTIYQLSSTRLKFGPQQIVRFTVGGLVQTGNSCLPIFSSGASTKINEAATKLIAETVERHDCVASSQSELVFAESSKLCGPFIRPESIISYGEQNYRSRSFPFTKFSDGDELHWGTVVAADTNETRFVPAQFLYAPFVAPRNEPALGLGTTSGVAAGRTKADATVRATLELVERDAAMATWYGRRGVAKIVDWERLISAQRAKKIASRIRAIKVYSMKGVVDHPCILATVENSDGKGPYISCATAADLSWRSAIERAVIDAVLTENWLLREGFQQIQHPDDIRRKQDHSRLYAHRKYAEEFSFLRGAPNFWSDQIYDVPENDNKDAAPRLVAELREHGFRLWIKDLTTELSRHLGYRVVRAVVPGLIPLQFGPKLVALGLPRLRQIISRADVGKESRHLPHPFG